MKIITIILSTIIMNACGGAKESAASEQSSEASVKKESTMAANDTQDQALQIQYTAATRGTYKQVEIANGKIQVKRSSSDKGTSVDCLKDQWRKIVSFSNDVNLENLSKLEAPSKASHYDGALAATLQVTKDGKTYKTAIFDHGNPPEEIKSLVDYILSLSKIE